ncbi:MAG TPA: adenylate/guanylate cyclase domain-containing protein [Gallionellaceae bacterium]|jgi:class 3 adenylate cyclase|nr:adenylate/guanylate cyclase domain-containing protein [Gallionellaceae bacterium]HQS75001.1 adenylate/guanylate cyclase domain-containing protein [Gallionellaceae bacterium]
MTEPQPVSVTSLEHSIWPNLHAELDATLKRLKLSHLSSPSMLILHDTIDSAVRAMQRNVFMQLVEADFGLGIEGNEESIEALYSAEVSEHGSQNIVQYCQQNGWQVNVSFPREAGSIVSLHVPVPWDIGSCGSGKLVEALGYQWQQSPAQLGAAGKLYTLKKLADRQAHQGVLLDQAGSASSVQHIQEKLGYGLIHFSSAGEVIAASPSMLASVRLPVEEAALATLSAAIPFNFANDIIWGLSLTGHSGMFENYRTRMHIPSAENVSVLFNVSGYRDEEAVIHSLWQVVSLTGSGSSLSEGCILSEARIHNITRNYVPQLVEAKAREAVRLGKDKLINEECFVAVLFCDIVGFTSYVESNASSESIINTLNTILRRVSSSVKRYNGSIDKFMGDSVMAIFRDPADAINAALDMQSHSADINGLRSRAGQETLRLRIGLHWGEVVIGNVGTEERLDWTAIGDVVNTASRIEKNCNPGAILVSKELRDAVVAAKHDEIQFAEVFQIVVKGKSDALSVCQVKKTGG